MENPLRRTKELYALNEKFLPVDIIAYTGKEFLDALENLSPSALDAYKKSSTMMSTMDMQGRNLKNLGKED